MSVTGAAAGAAKKAGSAAAKKAGGAATGAASGAAKKAGGAATGTAKKAGGAASDVSKAGSTASDTASKAAGAATAAAPQAQPKGPQGPEQPQNAGDKDPDQGKDKDNDKDKEEKNEEEKEEEKQEEKKEEKKDDDEVKVKKTDNALADVAREAPGLAFKLTKDSLGGVKDGASFVVDKVQQAFQKDNGRGMSGSGGQSRSAGMDGGQAKGPKPMGGGGDKKADGPIKSPSWVGKAAKNQAEEKAEKLASKAPSIRLGH